MCLVEKYERIWSEIYTSSKAHQVNLQGYNISYRNRLARRGVICLAHSKMSTISHSEPQDVIQQ